MLSDPAPDLLVNDIPASSPNSATGRSTAPQHTAKIIGCSLAQLPDQRTRHTGGVLPVVTGFRERLPVGGEVLPFFVPGVPRVFVPCRVVCRSPAAVPGGWPPEAPSTCLIKAMSSTAACVPMVST